jgi:hypothetical protein
MSIHVVRVCGDQHIYNDNHSSRDDALSLAETHHRSAFLLDLLDHRPIIRPLRIQRRRFLRVPSDPDQGTMSGSISDVGHVVEEGDFETVGVLSDCVAKRVQQDPSWSVKHDNNGVWSTVYGLPRAEWDSGTH